MIITPVEQRRMKRNEKHPLVYIWLRHTCIYCTVYYHGIDKKKGKLRMIFVTLIYAVHVEREI